MGKGGWDNIITQMCNFLLLSSLNIYENNNSNIIWDLNYSKLQTKTDHKRSYK